MNIKNITVINTLSGETKTFDTLDDFKNYFKEYDTILEIYNKHLNKTGDESFLSAFNFNWNCFKTNFWSIIDYTIPRKQKSKEKGNGEGTFYYSETLKCYVLQYIEPLTKKRKTLKQKKSESNADFKKRVKKVLSNIDSGTYTCKSNETIVTLLTEYIEQKHKDGITSGRSYKRELETLEQIKKTCSLFCDIPIQKVTIKHIENAKQYIKLYSNNVINKIWVLLEKAFAIACSPSRKILMFNLMTDVNLTKPISVKLKKPLTALTLDEYNKLTHVLDNEERNHPYRNIVKMQCISGMRIGEVLARSFDDYDKSNGSFNVHNTLTQDENYNYYIGKHTKTYDKKNQKDKGQRYLPLNTILFSPLIDIIEEERQKRLTNIHNLLFWDYKGNKLIAPVAINSWLSRLNKKYNISPNGLSSHRLRHYAITYWGIIGIPLPIIQYLAGHVDGSDITSGTYINISFDSVFEQLKKNFG